MELDSVYQNVNHKDVKNTHGPQIQIQSLDEGHTQKRRGGKCLVVMTVCLGIFCVVLLLFIIVQQILFKAEKDQLNTYKSTAEELSQNYTDLSLKKLELETDLRKLFEQGKGWFFISVESKNWSESRQYCRDHGGDLVIIKSEVKQRFISSLVQEYVWIGLSDIENEGRMTWVDDSPLNQGFWEENEPNDAGGIEDCIEVNPKLVLNNWNDIPCSVKRKWVCENSTSVPASS